MAEVPQRPSICMVCGNKALGFNYGVESCNACKMFFRRHTPETRYKPCRFNNKCYDVVVPNGVKGCKICRLEKCLRTGMVKTNNNQSAESKTPSNGSTPSPKLTLATVPSTVQKSIVTQVHIDTHLFETLGLLHKTRQEVYEVISVMEDPSFADLVLQGSNLSRYQRPQNICWELTERKLKPWGSLGMLLAVEVIKCMPFYSSLSSQDRLILLQGAAFKFHHLAIAFDSYSVNRTRVLTPYGDELFPKILFCFPDCKEIIDELVTLPMEPLQELQINEREYLLIALIMVCNPALGGLSVDAQHILSREQNNASRMLLKQCLLRDAGKGPARYAKMLAISEHLNKQRKVMRRLNECLKGYKMNIPIPRILREPCNMWD